MSLHRKADLVRERVELARVGSNPRVVHRLASGWLVVGDRQPRAGYCLLLADPLVASLNDLAEAERIVYLSDMAAVGDALLEVTGAARINYEMLGNQSPVLHTHITPRYADEGFPFRHMSPGFLRVFGRPMDADARTRLIGTLREALALRTAPYS